MTRRGMLIALLGIIYSLTIGYVSYMIGKNATENTLAALDNKVVAESITTNTPLPSEKTYTIKEFNGNIAVFEGDELIRSVDVDLETFRAEDRELLKKGIEVKTREEMAQVLEDYSS